MKPQTMIGQEILDTEIKEEMYNLLEAAQGGASAGGAVHVRKLNPADMDPEIMQGAGR